MTIATQPVSSGRVPLNADSSIDECADVAAAWVDAHVPTWWREAAERGGASAIREVRSRTEYDAWYPVFGHSGLVMPTWAPEHGGLGLTREGARAVATVLAPYNLRALNQLGLNNAAAALFSQGTEEQRRRFLPPIVTNEERWCQLFSEPGAGSDLASLATRAERDGDEWIITGQKVWSTWATDSEFAILLARTNPDKPKNRGITYFLIDLRQPGIEVRPLRQITGDVEFNEVFLDGARVPDFQRVGDIDNGWKVANATLSSERQMVAGEGSGGIGRIGGSGVTRLIKLARRLGRWDDPILRDRLVGLWVEEQMRSWTNARVRATLKAGHDAGPAASIGKVHQATLNQRIQLLATDLLGASAMAWETDRDTELTGPERYGDGLPYEVSGMLRSRANSIEGGTTEVNKNIVAERVLGLPRETDQWHGKPWREVPRA